MSGLLRQVHLRTGLGVDISTWVDGTVEIRWKRDYDGVWSDERMVIADSLDAALRGVLKAEDEADAEEEEDA